MTFDLEEVSNCSALVYVHYFGDPKVKAYIVEQGFFFWTFWKKLKLRKTQNSSKIQKKLKQNPEKTQKLPTPVELSWRIFLQTLKFSPFCLYVINFWTYKFESTLQLQRQLIRYAPYFNS